MAAENCLWGAPRIHGELLKLGIAVSERTVSRYLRGRPTTRSQTWRIFFANHLGGQTTVSPVMFADMHHEGTIHGPIVDCGRSLEPSSLGVGLGQHHVQDCTGARNSSGRDPPRDLRLQAASRRPRRLSFVRADRTFATDGSVRSIYSRVLGRMQS